MSEVCPRSARRVRWTPRLLLFLLLLLPLFPGCKGFDTPWGGGSDPDDPLRPGGPLPTAPNTPAPPPQPQPQPPPPPQPAVPVTAPTTSWGNPTATTPAGQAMAGTRPTDPATDPRSAGLPSGQSGDGSGSWSRAPSAGGSTGTAQLHPPETGGGPGTATPGVPTSEVRQAGGVQTVDSLDQAFQQLDSCGMNWFQLKQDGTNSTTFVFECSLANKQNPGVVDYIEGKGNSRLAALRDALDQINRKK